MWPMGGSVGLTDSIPRWPRWSSLFSAWLPPLFQFIGMWLVLSAALQGAFGALLMQLATPRPVLQWLGAMLFVLSPPLIIRFGHLALTAHWLLLAALWLALQADADRVSRRRAVALGGPRGGHGRRAAVSAAHGADDCRRRERAPAPAAPGRCCRSRCGVVALAATGWGSGSRAA
jgi:hypothetical protein